MRENLVATMEEPTVPVHQAVKQALTCSGYQELRDLDVSSVNGCVRVAGCVHSFFLKQKVQTIAMAVAEDRALQNEVVVR